MRSKLGILSMVLGVCLMLGAAFLHYANQREDHIAQEAVTDVMPQLVQQIQTQTATEATVSQEETIPELELQIPVELLTDEDKKMTEAEINGYLYIGYLSVPDLGLELPILSSWSYPKLNISPCRYTGSIRGEDLVLMAHNYNSHFGRLSQLDLGDTILFTDMAPTDVVEMTSGDFDLTLFTCTYGGGSRVTVYCDRV